MYGFGFVGSVVGPVRTEILVTALNCMSGKEVQIQHGLSQNFKITFYVFVQESRKSPFTLL